LSPAPLFDLTTVGETERERERVKESEREKSRRIRSTHPSPFVTATSKRVIILKLCKIYLQVEHEAIVACLVPEMTENSVKSVKVPFDIT